MVRILKLADVMGLYRMIDWAIGDPGHWVSDVNLTIVSVISINKTNETTRVANSFLVNFSSFYGLEPPLWTALEICNIHWKPLNVMALSQREPDNINRMITISK